MVSVQLFKDNELIRSFQFYDLLDGLVWIFRNKIDFDVLRVDDTVVSKCQFRRYLETVNNYYKRVYGTHYELEDL
jgi:hypothetical protein